MTTERSPLKRALRAVDELQARLRSIESAQNEPIAVIGIGCRFPGGARTPRKFWENLRDGVDAVTLVPPDRWDADEYFDPDPEAPGKIVTREGGFVEGIHDTDTGFFGHSAHLAYRMDPQQKMVQEVAWEAIEHAGLSPARLEGSATGLFLGMWSVDYWQQLMERPCAEINGFEGFNTHSLAAGFLSYFLNLSGPSLVVDTACSSSLVTIHLACQSLRAGESDLALAGGVNVILSPKTTIGLSKKKVLAPDGRCKAFDAAADGFGRGEGCGVVVLKRLSDARADSDRVLALVRGTAINQDGRGTELTVPNGAAQKAAISKALARSGIAARSVEYVEAHGTGTAVGDPVEIQALADVYGAERTPGDPLLVGSVKTNIGHLETASGVAGFIKVVLALQNEAIPPNLHFRVPNPQIPWDRTPVRVPTEMRSWPRAARPRFAAVSSFGISGTNAHLILEEAPRRDETRSRPELGERPRHVLTLAAKSNDALSDLASHYEEFLASEADAAIADVCFTANTGRGHFRQRIALVGADGGELRRKLVSFREGKRAPGLSLGALTGRAEAPRIAFLFTGQGSQHAEMGRRLFDTQPTFRRIIERCDEILRPLLDQSLIAVLRSTDDPSPVDQTRFTQPCLFSVELALAELLRSWGVEPSMVLGHSVGEYAAACLAGVFTLEDGLRLVAERARLMQELPADGRMLVVFADEARVGPAIARYGDRVSLAAANGPRNTVISGAAEAIESIRDELGAQGVETASLNVSHAFHSSMIEPMLEPFQEVARTVRYSEPRIPLLSNLTGRKIGSEIASAEYWVRHARQPVRFADAIRHAYADGCRIFVEIGPQPALSSMGRKCLEPHDPAVWLAPLRKGHDDWDSLLESLCELFVRGVPIDWRAFDDGYDRRKVVLPTYPFQRQRYHVGPVANAVAVPQDEVRGDGGVERLVAEFEQSGRYSDGEMRLLRGLLGSVGEEHRRRDAERRGVVAEYYDAIPAAASELRGGSREDEDERFLTFGPLARVVPGFSWALTFFDPERHSEFANMCLEAQKEMRHALFRKVDFSRCRAALDFGCGYGSDVIALARQQEHLKLHGYTIAGEQAAIGRKKVSESQLDGRVTIFHRDSARDEFPGRYDLVFGFEVAHHIRDKRALFRNIRDHLNDRGMLVLADFVSRTGFAIEHDDTSSFFAAHEEWVDLLSSHGLRIVDCIDISPEISNFLDDPDFDATLERLDPFRRDTNIRAAFKSYDQLGKLLRRGLADYILLTAEKEDGASHSELERWNHDALRAPLPYSSITLRGCSYEQRWEPLDEIEPAARLETATGDPAGWLILADREGIGDAVADRLRRAGQRAVIVEHGETFRNLSQERWQIRPTEPDDFRKLLADAFEGRLESCSGVLHLWSLDAPDADAPSIESLREAGRLSCASTLHILQALIGSKGFEATQIWLVTRGAHHVGASGSSTRLAQAPLAGMGKTLAWEHPERWGGMLDLPLEGGPERAAEVLVGVLGRHDREFQLAYRGTEWFVPRLIQRPDEPPRPLSLSPDATYLIAGGTGALGGHVARWMADHGARNLLLTSRRGSSAPGCAERLRELERAGVRVRVARCDVSDRDQVTALVDGLLATEPPLRGVVHAAGVLDDGVLAHQDWGRFTRVLAAKVEGAWNLHEATRDSNLDFFVCFSSAASLLGSPGQANYAAANAFLDALAHHRRSAGLPALTVNWGAWAEAGMAAELSDVNRRRLAALGLGEIAPEDGVRVLGELLGSSAVQVGVFPIRWSRFLQQFRKDTFPRFFARVAEGVMSTDVKVEKDILETLRQAPVVEREGLVVDYVDRQVAHVLGFGDNSTLDQDLSLLDLGFDSLLAVQLRNHLRAELGVDLALGEVFHSSSIREVAALLSEQLTVASVSSFDPSAPEGNETSEAEVEWF